MQYMDAPVELPSRAFFTFNPRLVLCDLSNIVLDNCSDGMDFLEWRMLEDLKAAGMLEHAQAVQQGILQLFEVVAGNADQAMLNFERMSAVTSLAVPPELFLEQPAAITAAAPALSSEEEAALDAELADLREQIKQASQQCRSHKQELAALEADLAAAGTASEFKPLLDAISGPVFDEVAAISSAAHNLQPLLARAQQVHGAAMARMDVDEIDAADLGAMTARHHMSENGASLQRLQAFQSALVGGA